VFSCCGFWKDLEEMSKVMLLYFGTLFLSKTIKGKPSTAFAIDWRTMFTLDDGTSERLSNIAMVFHDDIVRDL